MVAVLAGAAEGEFDHVGFAHNDTELTAQRRDQRPVLLPMDRPAAAGSIRQSRDSRRRQTDP
jgi:hypothetical protein